MKTTSGYVTETPSGETFAAKWDHEGNMIAICGSLHDSEVTQANLDEDNFEWLYAGDIEEPLIEYGTFDKKDFTEWLKKPDDEKFFPRGYRIKEPPYSGDGEEKG